MSHRHDDAVDLNQIMTCPKNVRHMFKEVRAKSKQVGNAWHFFKACTRCTAFMETIVTHETRANGDIIPVAKAYLITATGYTPLNSKVQAISNAAAGVEESA